MSCSVWTSAYFRRSIKRLAKKYASVADDYNDKSECETIKGKVLKILLQKCGIVD